jgi:hypothetical protein
LESLEHVTADYGFTALRIHSYHAFIDEPLELVELLLSLGLDFDGRVLSFIRMD